MSRPLTDRDDFYIGYLPKAPGRFRRDVRLAILPLIMATVAVAVLLSGSQRSFSLNTFEYGTLTTIEGVIVKAPVPRIVMEHDDQQKSIMLVGFGKCGALSTIEAMENDRQVVLDQQRVRMRGTLIYGEGKTWMELTEGEKGLLELLGQSAKPVDAEASGQTTFEGKIIDPKCYFGVMKPGEGKTHRACAIRCISGGIAPILKVQDTEGTRFIILSHQDASSVNQSILPFVDDRIRVTGQLFTAQDWQQLKIDPTTIMRLD